MPDFNLITWNIQSCRGCDGVVDAARIARTAAKPRMRTCCASRSGAQLSDWRARAAKTSCAAGRRAAGFHAVEV